MKKKYVLKKNLDFQKIINSKQQIINKFVILYFVDYSSFEIGISIPKKFAKAYQRNYVKRQIKWILDSFVNYKSIKKRIVLIVRKDFLTLSIDDRKNQIIKMFNKFNK